jgi:hypothetical protein
MDERNADWEGQESGLFALAAQDGSLPDNGPYAAEFEKLKKSGGA